jgi:hypothetical protein
MFFRKPKVCVFCGNKPAQLFGTTSNIFLAAPDLNIQILKNKSGQYACSDERACHQTAQMRQAQPISNEEIYSQFIESSNLVRPLTIETRASVYGPDKRSWDTGSIHFRGYTGFKRKYMWGAEELTYTNTYRLVGEIVFNESWFKEEDDYNKKIWKIENWEANRDKPEPFSHPFTQGEMYGQTDSRTNELNYFSLKLRARERAAGLIKRKLAETFCAKRGGALFTFRLRKPTESDIEQLCERGLTGYENKLIVDSWDIITTFAVEGDLSNFDGL